MLYEGKSKEDVPVPIEMFRQVGIVAINKIYGK